MQEVDEPARSTSATCGSRAFRQYAALATERAAAIVLGEAVDHGLVHVAPSDARETKPARKMLSLRAVTALADNAISHDLEMMREGREMRGDVIDILGDWNIAAILQEADETANAADIDRATELAAAVTRAATSVPCETIDNRVVRAGRRNAAAIEPKQEVSCRAAVVPGYPRRARAAQMLEKRGNQRVLPCGYATCGSMAIRVRVLGRSHVGPFGLREKGPQDKERNYAE